MCPKAVGPKSYTRGFNQAHTEGGEAKQTTAGTQQGPPIPRTRRAIALPLAPNRSDCPSELGKGARYQTPRRSPQTKHHTKGRSVLLAARRRVDSTKTQRPAGEGGRRGRRRTTGLRCPFIECRGFNSIQSKDSGRWHASWPAINRSILCCTDERRAARHPCLSRLSCCWAFGAWGVGAKAVGQQAWEGRLGLLSFRLSGCQASFGIVRAKDTAARPMLPSSAAAAANDGAFGLG